MSSESGSVGAFWLGLVGTITGVAGFLLGLLNYLRDRPRIVVTVKWDMIKDLKSGVLIWTPIAQVRQRTGEPFAVFSVTNTGRRPVYITLVGLQVGYKQYHLIKTAMGGQRLGEGDSPISHIAPYSDLGNLPDARWQEVRGMAIDSAGKEYFSKRLSRKDLPSWAKPKTNAADKPKPTASKERS